MSKMKKEEVYDGVKEAVEEVRESLKASGYKISTPLDDADLFNGGDFDSLKKFAILSAIEKSLGVEFPDDYDRYDLWGCGSLIELQKKVWELVKPS